MHEEREPWRAPTETPAAAEPPATTAQPAAVVREAIDLPGIEERIKPAIQQLFDKVWQEFILVQLRYNIAAFTVENWHTLLVIVADEEKRRSS